MRAKMKHIRVAAEAMVYCDNMKSLTPAIDSSIPIYRYNACPIYPAAERNNQNPNA